VTWRAEYEPYGTVYALRAGDDKHQPLRFPGQEVDGVTDESYNIFRWYRSGWGRYTQADPIGLRGGSNLYAYTANDPIGSVDPLGLWTLHKSCKGFEAIIVKAMAEAVAGISKCLKCGEKDKVISSLMDATIKCDLGGTGCGNNPWGSTIVLEQPGLIGSAGCRCLPALLAHDAAHDLQPWWDNSEGVPEVIENKCFTCGNNDNHLPPPRIGPAPKKPYAPPSWSSYQ
jgi:RHS repeat-associated protein